MDAHRLSRAAWTLAVVFGSLPIVGRLVQGDWEFVTAAEIACWAYCPEQWRLQYGLELLPVNREPLDAGTRNKDVFDPRFRVYQDRSARTAISPSESR